jgi:hypothetical protein
MRNGQEREFIGVDRHEASALVNAPSPGKFYMDEIRKKFPRIAA